MLTNNLIAGSVKDQYEQFLKERVILDSKIETFLGVDGFDVYNPSLPFTLQGKTYIAGRVEKRGNEFSEVKFFEKKADAWHLVSTPKLILQDPFLTTIDNTLILGGVNVTWGNGQDTTTTWKTAFYKMHSLHDFEFLVFGPNHMKDIRLLQLLDQRIAVFSRPQGASVQKRLGGIARIGFTVIEQLSDLNASIIENAPYLEGLFKDDEWGGANQLYNLKNGLIGVAGHKSYRSFVQGQQQLHYYGITFALDPNSRKLTQTKVIISADCFPEVEPKRPDIKDVTFMAGLIRRSDKTAEIYTGVADAHVGKAIIPDPFLDYETL